MAMITVLRPDQPADDALGASHPLAPRAAISDGAVLTLVDNGKSHARFVLLLVADEIRSRLPQIGEVDVVSKTSAGVTLTADQAQQIAARSALVVAGLGDCGACSSCSTLDAIAVEKLGTPATVVITEPFVGLVDRFARKAGMPGYHTAVLPHPVATRPDDEVRSLVAALADQIVAQLCASAAAPALV